MTGACKASGVSNEPSRTGVCVIRITAQRSSILITLRENADVERIPATDMQDADVNEAVQVREFSPRSSQLRRSTNVAGAGLSEAAKSVTVRHAHRYLCGDPVGVSGCLQLQHMLIGRELGTQHLSCICSVARLSLTVGDGGCP